MSNVIAVDFRARRGARSIAPLPGPDHIVCKRVAELTRLLKHRYPGPGLIPIEAGSVRIAHCVIDHLSNLPDGLHHARAWLAEHFKIEDDLDQWQNGAPYWYKGPLGTQIALTTAEARALQIKTIEAKPTRRKWKA